MGLTDKQLIEKALKLNCIDWAIASDYAKLAKSIEAKERLRKIESALYRTEEYISNCL